MALKSFIRTGLNFLHLDLTKNLAYDRLTKKVIKKAVKTTYNTIDVGCHKGEILDELLKCSPQGKHFGFEPIPQLFEDLVIKYKNKATIFPFALSDKEGKTTFNFVKNAPAYSGINKRKYAIENPDIEEIEVELKKLDDVIPKDLPIHFIKIDVEGAELGVLKGATKLLKKNKPVVIFECGLGASEYYNTTPEKVFDFFDGISMKLFLINDWLKENKPLSKNSFVNLYTANKEYYFIAN